MALTFSDKYAGLLVVVAPIFLLLGSCSERRPWLDMLLTSGGFLILAILSLVFLRDGPVT